MYASNITYHKTIMTVGLVLIQDKFGNVDILAWKSRVEPIKLLLCFHTVSAAVTATDPSLLQITNTHIVCEIPLCGVRVQGYIDSSRAGRKQTVMRRTGVKEEEKENLSNPTTVNLKPGSILGLDTVGRHINSKQLIKGWGFFGSCELTDLA